MSKIGLFPKAIRQVDNHTFVIDWDDGESFTYRLAELQWYCPCANCLDDTRSKRRENAAKVEADVRAEYIKSVGHYGIKIVFTSGCSQGIFSYPYLYRLGAQSAREALR